MNRAIALQTSLNSKSQTTKKWLGADRLITGEVCGASCDAALGLLLLDPSQNAAATAADADATAVATAADFVGASSTSLSLHGRDSAGRLLCVEQEWSEGCLRSSQPAMATWRAHSSKCDNRAAFSQCR